MPGCTSCAAKPAPKGHYVPNSSAGAVKSVPQPRAKTSVNVKSKSVSSTTYVKVDQPKEAPIVVPVKDGAPASKDEKSLLYYPYAPYGTACYYNTLLNGVACDYPDIYPVYSPYAYGYGYGYGYRPYGRYYGYGHGRYGHGGHGYHK